MITALSYGQNTNKSIFNHKNDTRLNKSFGVFNQENIPEKPIPFNDDELNLDNFDAINQKNNKNTTLYSSKNEGYTMQLDSISDVSFGADGITGKNKYTYDENGRIKIRISYQWNSQTAVFISSTKSEYTYNENGRTTLQISYQWNTQTAAFIPYTKSEYTYDGNGRTTLQISYQWNTQTAAFIPYTKYENTYDENGRTTLQIYYQWNTQTAAFIPYTKYENTYDENGRTTRQIIYEWNTQTAALVPSYKYEYTYDENGRTTRQIIYEWNTQTAAFIPSTKSENTYDGNGRTIGSTSFSWNSNIEIFYPTAKTVYDFDNQMRVVSINTYGLDICNNEKVLTSKAEYFYINGLEGQNVKNYRVTNGVAVFNFESGSFYKNGRLVLRSQSVNPDLYGSSSRELYNWKREYKHDENGYITLEIVHKWDTQTAALVLNYKKENTYDEENNFKQEMYSKWYANLGVYKGSFKKEYSVIVDTETKRVKEGLLFVYDTNFNQWNALNDEKYKSYWYYTKTSTLSSQSFNKNTSFIFPNPTSGFLKVSLSEELFEPLLEIFDATGKIVLSKQLLSDESIDVSALTPALYFYKIKDGKVLKKSGKIIKQ